MPDKDNINRSLKIDISSLDLSPTPTYVVNGEGRILYFNRAMEELFGYSPPQYLGQTISMLAVDPEDAYRTIRANLDQGLGIWQGEMEVRSAAGRTFPCQISANRFRQEPDGRILTIGLVTDVSHRREITDQLKSRSDRLGALASLAARIGTYRDPLRLAYESLSVIAELTMITCGFILILDEETGRLRLHSSLNLDEDALIVFQDGEGWESCLEGRAIREKVPIMVRPAGDDPGICCPLKSHMSSVAVIPLIIQDRITGVLSVSTEPPDELAETDMEFLVALASQIGIYLENASLNRRLEDRNRQLQSQNEDLQELLSIISHDLRSPLATIGGYASLLMKKGDELDSAERKSFAETIFRKTRETSKRFDDLLAFFRLTLESEKTPPEEVDVARTLRQCLEEAGPEPVVSVFNIELPDNLPTLIGYPAHLTHIFCNLLSNAVKFTMDSDNPQITISYEKVEENGKVLHSFTVADNGPGIPADYHESIFKPFHRVPAVEDIPGTGVGLAAAHRIVRLHGGTITVSSEPDQGAAFTFRLPWQEVQ